MSYAWGTEIVTEQALRDPSYLSTLKGLAVVRRHPRSGRVDVAERETGDGRVVGAVLDARYDEADRCVVLEILVQDPGAIEDVRSGVLAELSEGYDVADLVVRPDGVGEQRKRAPNHVALVERGRMPGATVRTDEEDPMDEDEIEDGTTDEAGMAERMDAMQAQLDAIGARCDAYEARMDAAEKRLPPELAAAAASEGARADSEDRIEAEITARDTLRRRADALGLRLPVDARSSAQLRAAIARGVLGSGADAADLARCDSADYADGVIRAARPPARTDAAPVTPSTLPL
jgi:hypothetical protein